MKHQLSFVFLLIFLFSVRCDLQAWVQQDEEVLKRIGRRSDPPPPNNWCNAVTMPSTLPFAFKQPIWWNEFFQFDSSETRNVTFKIYPGVRIDSALLIMWAIDDCPILGNIYEWAPRGPASLSLNVVTGQSIILLTRLQGGNYTIFGCENSCPQICPNDCGSHGFCQVETKHCLCDFGYQGSACASLCNVTACCLSEDPNPNCCNPSLCCVGNTTSNNPNCKQTVPVKHGPPIFKTWGEFLGLVGGLGGFLIIVVGTASLMLYFTFKKNNTNGNHHNNKAPFSVNNNNGYHPLPTTIS